MKLKSTQKAKISMVRSEKRPKTPLPPSEMRHFLSQSWRSDLLFLGLGLGGAVGVVLFGYFSSLRRQRLMEKGEFSVEAPFRHQEEEEDFNS